MIQAERYPAQVFWSDEDQGYIAVAIDLPGCSAFGESRERALSELLGAIEAWIQAADVAGNSIPPPSRPAEQTEHIGRMLVRMPKDLHARLAKSATTQGVSLNQYMVYLLTWSLTDHNTSASMSTLHHYAVNIIPRSMDYHPAATILSVASVTPSQNTVVFHPTTFMSEARQYG